MKKIIILTAILFASTCHAEEIIVEMAVGCPTIEAYEKYLTVALAGNGSETLQVAADLNCRMMLKGEKVKVLHYKMSKNLVEVLPDGNTMTFWLPSEFVSSTSIKQPEEKTKELTETILEFAPFVVRLSDQRGKRYIKLRIAMEFESKELLIKGKQLAHNLSNLFKTRISSYSSDEILTIEGKTKLKQELIKIVNSKFSPDHIKDLYFTEFVIQ